MPTVAPVVGQTPLRTDLTIYQGDDFYLDIAVDDTLVPIDLTDYTAEAQIRVVSNGTPSTVLATFDATIADPLTVSLHLPHAQSSLLYTNGVWDVQITDTAGRVTTLVYGSVTVMKEVTR